MNNLWIYGCSFSESSSVYQELCEKHDTNKPDPLNIYKYFIYRNKRLPDSWDMLLSKKLDLNLINNSEGGISNQEIFHRFLKTYDRFNDGDVIVIEWTFVERFRMALNNHNWSHILPNTGVNNLSNTTTEEISVNRLFKIYEDEINDYMKVIKTICEHKKVKIYFWTIDKRLIYNKLERDNNILLRDLVPINESPLPILNVMGGETISQETNHLIENSHFGEKSHIITSDLFYEQIKKDLVN